MFSSPPHYKSKWESEEENVYCFWQYSYYVDKSKHLFGGYYGARYCSKCFYILTHLILSATL